MSPVVQGKLHQAQKDALEMTDVLFSVSTAGLGSTLLTRLPLADLRMEVLASPTFSAYR